jgi:hypothetical protein
VPHVFGFFGGEGRGAGAVFGVYCGAVEAHLCGRVGVVGELWYGWEVGKLLEDFGVI